MSRLSDPVFQDSGLQKVLALLGKAGHQALLVGGSVRNGLLGAPVSDFDVSTDARPDRVMALAEAAGIKAVPTGIDHGTVTLVEDHTPVEVTTFRRDVSTDGRRAVVAFSTDVAEDAARRDFTMNALYAQADGTIVDPLGGLPDLWARRVRFIGRAEDRIHEDYLRILRFFRFHAWYGDPEAGFDADEVAACADGIDGLARLSRERIGHEMMKLLTARDPAVSVAILARIGGLAAILPGAMPDALGPLVHLEQQLGLAPDPVRRLAALGGAEAGEALRLSRAGARRATLLTGLARDAMGPAEAGYRHGAADGWDAMVIRAALLGQPVDEDTHTLVLQGAAAEFPVRAADLMDRFKGSDLGRALTSAETAWIASGFTADKATLLAGLE